MTLFTHHSVRATAIGLVCFSFLGASTGTFAQDRVTYWDDQQNEITDTGEIIEFDSNELRLRRPQGTTRRIPAARVTQVHAARGPEHQKADAAFDTRDYDRALSLYRRAYSVERRGWAKQQLVAKSILCQRNLGQAGSAASMFLALMTQEPGTPFAAVIPLAWRSEVPDLEFEAQLNDWLRDPRPVARLIAASWLLSGRHRPAAQRELRQLVEGPSDEWVVHLARAQGWRSQLVSVDRQTIEEWQRTLAAMPDKFQAGPLLIVATALAHLEDHDAAVIAYLQVALMHEQPEDLVVESLWAAGRLLDRADRSGEAERVYRELSDRFPESALAVEARQSLRRLENRRRRP